MPLFPVLILVLAATMREVGSLSVRWLCTTLHDEGVNI